MTALRAFEVRAVARPRSRVSRCPSVHSSPPLSTDLKEPGHRIGSSSSTVLMSLLLLPGDVRLQQRYVCVCVYVYLGLLLLLLAGLQEVEAAAAAVSSSSGIMSSLNWKPFIYGGMASIVAEFGTFPIDLTKTRLQVQGQAQYMEVRYKGMFHALSKIGREEGVRALYSGISPALLRQASYGTIKIGTYNTLKRFFVNHPEEETLVLNVFCGVVSGIRMQAQGSLMQGSMISNFVNIYQTEGTRGLWRGVIPTAQRAAIVVGVELPVYDITKKHLIGSGVMDDTILTHFISSFSCGLAGALASNPVDVVRTRMMNQRVLSGAPVYKGTVDGVMQTWRNEGFLALYKVPLDFLLLQFFITFEQLNQLPL
ncbi:hypothetical protein CRUP_030843 [Coryphaenoides rupestris]|nr:hypothetical protein CRUP_030843 [Coryphaenoides rupestris]